MHTRTRKNLILSAGLSLLALLTTVTVAQTPRPSPSASPSEDGNYTIDSSVEFGYRGLSVNGNDQKYRSDLNYRPGLRVFNSSFFIENKGKGEMNFFDQALVTSSGWGSDPQGSFRFNMDKAGIYKFDSNVRRVHYFNSLNTHAINWNSAFPTPSEHSADTLHNFGDLDLTIFPENERFRMRFGYSYSDTNGPGFNTLRFRSDEFMVSQLVDNISNDFRAGADWKALGFNFGVTWGHRLFKDRNEYLVFPSAGNNTLTNTSALTSGFRMMPIRGNTDYGNFFVQRTFAKKFDFTGRFIYADTIWKSNQSDLLTGLNSCTGNNCSRNIITGDTITVPGRAERPQSRADIGLTYQPVDRLRISNTFTFDQFHTTGDETLQELLAQTTSTGGAVANTLTSSQAYRLTAYRRFTNLIEADFQVNRMFAFNVGYRYTHRSVTESGLDFNLINPINNSGLVCPATVSSPNPNPSCDDAANTTNSFIVGTKIKPIKDWSIYADFERGSADNVFTRLGNDKYLNFRVRSIARLKQFTLNFSGLIRNNDDPGLVSPGVNNVPGTVVPTSTIANTRNRYFSGSIDYNPVEKWSLSAGYTYNYLTADTDILVQVNAPINSGTNWLFGKSMYYVRDNYFFFDVNARPTKWMTFFASYRFDKDTGQGDTVITRPQDIITSYPFRFHMPEVKLAFRLTKNIDWNVGYQYYGYTERQYINPFASNGTNGTTVAPYTIMGIAPQNYTAHMPYTSLTIYFGRSADR